MNPTNSVAIFADVLLLCYFLRHQQQVTKNLRKDERTISHVILREHNTWTTEHKQLQPPKDCQKLSSHELLSSSHSEIHSTKKKLHQNNAVCTDERHTDNKNQ